MEHYRLTNDIREQVLRALLKRYDEEQGPAGDPEDPARGTAVYRRLLGARGLRWAEALPKGWLPTTSSLYVKVGERRYTVELSELLPIPHSAHAARYHMELRPTDPLARRLVRHEELCVAQRDARRELVGSIRARLSSSSTTRTLLVAWPEIAPFLPSAGGGRPVAPVDSAILNKTLGLKPSKKK